MAQQPAQQTAQPRQTGMVAGDVQLGRIRFSPCGNILAGGAYDATVRRWRLTPGGALEPLPTLTGHHGWVQALAFQPDARQRRLFTADSWGEIRAWDYAESEPQPAFTVAAAHDGWVRELALSPDGRLLASCGRDRKVCVWSAADGTKVRELTGHPDDVFCIAFHQSGTTLVSGDLRGNVYEWDLETGQRGRTFDCRSLYALSRLQDIGGLRRLAFDASGRTLVCAGGRPGGAGGNCVPTMLLFDWATGQVRQNLSIGVVNDGFIFDLAFTAAGHVMGVTSGTPGSGKFFLHRPSEQAPYFLSTAMPNCHGLALHPDRRRVVVSATNGGSNGNGRPLRNGVYAANTSPLHVWELPTAQ
jgi:WD40 repeat protein